jgi:hypothetical protein
MLAAQVVSGQAGLPMKPRLAIGLVAMLIAPTAPSDAASCRHQRAHDCFKLPATLDFSSVPEISNRIVADEPASRAQQDAPVDQQPETEPYTGPMIGVASHTGAPTVGYYWSIH